MEVSTAIIMWMSKSVIAVMKDSHFGNYMCLVYWYIIMCRCPSVHAIELTIPTAIISSDVVTLHK